MAQERAKLKIIYRSNSHAPLWVKDHATAVLHFENDDEVKALYDEWDRSLERKPYPLPEAIANVFQLALRRDPEIADFNPLAMWDTHYVRELDDSGYIDQLYR